MQFQVPQFIETEDKIIGPLSLRQFIYIAVGAGISFSLYFAVQVWVFAILSVIFLGASAALAFVQINGQPLVKIIIAAFHFYWSPQTYVWQPNQPTLPKNQETLKGETKEGFSLEKVVAGFALKNAWRYLQTGSKAPEEAKEPEVEVKTKETYQAFREITGERKVARRIDYR